MPPWHHSPLLSCHRILGPELRSWSHQATAYPHASDSHWSALGLAQEAGAAPQGRQALVRGSCEQQLRDGPERERAGGNFKAFRPLNHPQTQRFHCPPWSKRARRRARPQGCSSAATAAFLSNVNALRRVSRQEPTSPLFTAHLGNCTSSFTSMSTAVLQSAPPPQDAGNGAAPSGAAALSTAARGQGPRKSPSIPPAISGPVDAMHHALPPRECACCETKAAWGIPCHCLATPGSISALHQQLHQRPLVAQALQGETRAHRKSPSHRPRDTSLQCSL